MRQGLSSSDAPVECHRRDLRQRRRNHGRDRPPAPQAATGIISGPFATALSPQAAVEISQSAPASMADGGADATYIYIGTGTTANSWPWNGRMRPPDSRMMYMQAEMTQAGLITKFDVFRRRTPGSRVHRNVRLILVARTSSWSETNLDANCGGFTPKPSTLLLSKVVGPGVIGAGTTGSAGTVQLQQQPQAAGRVCL